MAALRILIGDDHTLVRQALRRLLTDVEGWQVVAEGADGEECIRLAVAERPDVAILDVEMPGTRGIDALREIRRQAASVRVLMLSMHLDDRFIREAFCAGAQGYLLKDAAAVDLISAVSAIAEGKSFFSPAVANLVRIDYLRRVKAQQPPKAFDQLSAREREVLQLVAEGRTNRRIAELLEIAPATVETHRAHILRKLDIHSTAELVRIATRQYALA